MRGRRVARMAMMLSVAIIGLAAAASGGDRPLVWWCWPPVGDAADGDKNPTFHRRVYVDTCSGTVQPAAPAAAALQAYQRIMGINASNPDGRYDYSNGVDPDYIDIHFQAYGYGNGSISGVPLVYHPDDALDPTTYDPSVVLHPWATPWMSHGINDSNPSGIPNAYWGAKAWTAQFIAEYKAIQDDPCNPNYCPDLGDPLRFHMDCEASLWGGPQGNNIADAERIPLFLALMEDGRWVSETIPGFDDPSADTMAELWLAFCEEQCEADPLCDPEDFDPDDFLPDPNYSTEALVNQAWRNWYYNLTYQAIDGGLNESLYSLVKDATNGWEGCKSSNDTSSVRIDGAECDDLDIGKHCLNARPGYWSWVHKHWSGSGDLQAPELYPFELNDAIDIANNLDPNMSYNDVVIWRNRQRLHSCIHSFGGGHSDEMTPWICLPNCEAYGGVLNGDGTRRLLALLRANNVNEMILYHKGTVWDDTENSTHETNCNIFSALVDQVWGADADFVEVKKGACTQSDLADLVRYSDGDSLEIASDYYLTGDKTRFRADFDTDFDTTPGGLRVHFEAKVTDAPVDATMTIKLRDFTNSEWDTIDTFTVDDNGDLLIDYVDVASGASDYIESGTDQVKVMMIIETLSYYDDFTAEIDLVQVVGLD